MADFQHQSLVESLTAIAPITLAEMDAIKLMNRVDTKYLTDEATLVQVLADAAAAGYRALETEGEKLSPYNSVYFDTAGLRMFLDHHNRRLVRQKVRTRSYLGSGITFLEIKRKNNKGRTSKKRTAISPGQMMDFCDNLEACADLSYKVNPYLKLGGGYIFIDKLKSSGDWSPRHRFYVDATGGIRVGDWRFSLRERLQLTHRNADDLNVFQANPNSLALKSRIKVQYKGRSVSPYAYVELRNVFNDPACTAKYDGSSFIDYVFTGYTDAYVNRLRGALGLEWKLSKQHALDLSILGDYCYDKIVDTNAEGTKLKSISYERMFNTNFCIGYKFSF